MSDRGTGPSGVGGSHQARDRVLFVPGRVELFGKHVDYGGGPSLTCAVDLGITARVSVIDAPVIDLEDGKTGRRARVPLRQDARPGGAHGGTYIAAVARRLARDFGPLRRGVHIESESALPRSAGLSSSSAFVTMLVLAVVEANALEEREEWQAHLGSRLALAEYCGAIEMGAAFGPWPGERGVGTRGGAQDHVAILCNRSGHAGAFSYLPATLVGEAHFPERWALLVGVSGVRATKTGGAQKEYNRAADLLRGMLTQWNRETGRSDTSLASALASDGAAPERLSRIAEFSADAPRAVARLAQFRRETEHTVPAALAAISAADAVALGRCAVESQQGAETALGNQVAETEFLTRAAMASGAHASCAFGAGFGGAVWAIAEQSASEAMMDEWRTRYARAFPARAGKAEWMRVQLGDGARWTH